MSTMPPTTRLPAHPPAAEPPPRLRPRPRFDLPWANLEIAPAADHRPRDRPYMRNLVVADLAATALGIWVCAAVAPASGVRPGVLLSAAVVGALLMLAGLYRRDELLIRKTTLDEAPRLAAVAGLSALLIWQAGDLLFTAPLGRSDVALLWGALLVALVGCRRMARTVTNRRTAAERCLLIGPAGSEERLHAAFAGAGD